MLCHTEKTAPGTVAIAKDGKAVPAREVPLAILLVGRSRGNFYKQMLWLMEVVTLYAIAFFKINNQIYGMVHMACWLTVPLLALYNGQRGKCRWLGKFFYWYYPAHMALIGVIPRLLSG